MRIRQNVARPAFCRDFVGQQGQANIRYRLQIGRLPPRVKAGGTIVRPIQLIAKTHITRQNFTIGQTHRHDLSRGWHDKRGGRQIRRCRPARGHHLRPPGAIHNAESVSRHQWGQSIPRSHGLIDHESGHQSVQGSGQGREPASFRNFVQHQRQRRQPGPAVQPMPQPPVCAV